MWDKVQSKRRQNLTGENSRKWEKKRVHERDKGMVLDKEKNQDSIKLQKTREEKVPSSDLE